MSRVQSIERAFAVLDALVDGPLGVTEVAARAGVPKSTAARLLNALQTEGAVEQLPGDTRYRLGRRLAVLASGLRDTRGLVAVARPTLVELADATGEAAGLSVADGFTVHYVDQVDSPNPVQVRDWTGSRIPMHAVSSGQVFLAFLPASALARFLASPLERLREVRRDGGAWVREELAEGITAVAAPVAAAGGEVVAAVHVHGPSYRFPRRGTEDAVAGRVLATAARISARIRESSGAGPER